MAQQTTLAMAAGFEKHAKRTRRAEFLSQMKAVVPWRDLVAEIERFYPKAGNGRPPVGLERMLRMYFLQQWFNLSDPAEEEALYDSHAMRAFVGIDLGREPVPDETTVCKFRHLLERHGLGAKIFARVNAYLESRGVKLGTGTIVDATLIAAPSSTRNKSGERDPEMHQVRKGNQWYFGMKAHVGVDADTKLIHTLAASAANVSDSKMLPELLRGDETAVWGDQAYQGQGCRAGRARSQGRRPHLPALALQAPGLARAARTQPHLLQDPLARGACDRRAEAAAGLHEGALSRHRQEPAPALHRLRAHQPHHSAKTPGPIRAVVCPKASKHPLVQSAKPDVLAPQRKNYSTAKNDDLIRPSLGKIWA